MADNVAKLIRRGAIDQAEREILLTDDVTTMGRAASCQVVIESDFAGQRTGGK